MKLFKSLALSLLCAASLSAQDSTATRQWTSLKGATVDAKAHGVKNGNVILEKANGSIVKVPVNMLVAADQKLLNEHFKAEAVDNGGNKPKPQDKDDDKDDKNGPKALGDSKQAPQKDVNGSTINLPYPMGVVTKDVVVDRNLKMDIYVPSTLRAGEKYPVMLIIEPKRGSHGRMNTFVQAAEQNEMIIATLPKISLRGRPQGNAGRNWPQNKIYVDAEALGPYVKDALRKLHKDFPVDTKRIYTAGVNDSVHLAMWAMKRIGGAGVLAINGGGRGEFEASNREAFVALCATRSKQRWDVATTFEESKGSSISYLSFYSGAGFPQRGKIEEAMLKLNAMFLLKHQKGTHELPAERIEEELMEYIGDVSGDGELVTPWIDFVERYGLIKDENTEKLEEWKKDVMKDKVAVKALEGHNDSIKALIRYYGTGWKGYINDNGKTSTENSLKRIAAKYKDTIWESTLNELSETAH